MTSNVNNPMQLLELIKGSKNPSQMLLNLFEKQSANNPIYTNILSLAKGGQTNEIEGIVRNMFKERGLDFDKEFNDFKQLLGLK